MSSREEEWTVESVRIDLAPRGNWNSLSTQHPTHTLSPTQTIKMAAISSDASDIDDLTSRLQRITFTEEVQRICGSFELTVKWNGKNVLEIRKRRFGSLSLSLPLSLSLSLSLPHPTPLHPPSCHD